jgi:hypothetical protein
LRAGYLAALAARTLGVTPILRPATPSRFEPEGPQAEMHEVVEVREAEPTLPAAPRSAPARADEQRADTATEAIRPRGFSGSGLLGEQPAVAGFRDGWAAPDVSGLAGDPAETVMRRQAAAPLSSRTADLEPFDSAATPSPGQAATGMASQDDQPLGRTADLAAPAAPPPAAPGSQAAWHVDVIQTGRSRQRAQAGEPGETSSTEPAIIVRIGRVDVRAVPAASPPAPAPRSRPAAGPSLAEYLLARDRRRR